MPLQGKLRKLTEPSWVSTASSAARKQIMKMAMEAMEPRPVLVLVLEVESESRCFARCFSSRFFFFLLILILRFSGAFLTDSKEV